MSEAQTIIYMSDDAEYGTTLSVQDVGEALTRALATGQPFVVVTLADEDGENYGPITINALQVTTIRSMEGVERAQNAPAPDNDE